MKTKYLLLTAVALFATALHGFAHGSMANAMIQAKPDVCRVFEDAKAEATFRSATSANGLWVSFDDTEIVKRKFDYMKGFGLGGAM